MYIKEKKKKLAENDCFLFFFSKKKMARWGRRKEEKIGRVCREKKEVETACKEGWGRELCKCVCV